MRVFEAPAAPAPVPAPALAAAPVDSPLLMRQRRGEFIVTVEIAPPDSPDPEALLARARPFAGLADALNTTDGAGANCHMASADPYTHMTHPPNDLGEH